MHSGTKYLGGHSDVHGGSGGLTGMRLLPTTPQLVQDTASALMEEALDVTESQAGLVVVHHSRAYTPPYFPGYRDLWDNIFLGRAASHPWGAMRAVGAFIETASGSTELVLFGTSISECSISLQNL